MATAIYVAQRALKLILVQAADSPLAADEYEDFYDAMNDFMADLEAGGVNLGYTTIAEGSDEITIPAGAIRGLISNMAVEVAPDYERPITPALQAQADKGMGVMRRIARKRVKTAYPSTLPRGSGNERFTYADDGYYSEQTRVRITLAGSERVTEIAAVDTPVLIDGFWKVVEATRLIADITGRITNSHTDALDITVDVEIEVTGGVPVTLHLYENGNESLKSVSGTADGSKIQLTHTTTILPNEFIELWIENTSDTTDLVVRDAQFLVT